MIVCSSERLQLRHLVDTDAAFILELLNDPDFIRNIADRGVSTVEAAAQYISAGPAASYARFGFGLFLVELRDPTVPIGICGLLRRDSHPDVEIGFAYLPAFRGQGYGFRSGGSRTEVWERHTAPRAHSRPDRAGQSRFDATAGETRLPVARDAAAAGIRAPQ